MIAAALAAVSLALAAPAPATATAPVKDPVAVMPFKNLNGDVALDWLVTGVAETMISDLRKSGKVRLVERERIAQAISEIAWQQKAGTEESTAARVGRLVGARTIVLGSFQQAGKQLRINARFVDVETGVILESVKTTGTMEDVFALQDQIVDKLLGVPPKAVARKPRKPAAPKTQEAYRLYAMGLITLSDAQQESHFKQALALDPDFVYASEALDALEERLAAYSARADKLLDERHKSIRARLYDAATPETERAQLAVTLMSELIQRRRFRIAADEARRIYDLKLPSAVNMDPREWASHNLVLAHKFLKRDDLALQYAERHLQEFAAGPTYPSVESMATEVVQRRKSVPEALARRESDHARIDNDIAERSKKNPLTPQQLAVAEMGRCTLNRYNVIPAETESDCRALLEKWEKVDPRPAQIDHVRYQRALALYELGRFTDAKAELKKLEEDAPQFFQMVNARMATSFWIADE